MQTLTRRQLGLGGAAVVAAAAASTLLQPAGTSTMRLGLGAMKPTSLRIGAILPTSPWDAELPRRIVAGLRDALSAPDWLSVEMVEREVVGGTVGIRSAASDLLARDVDVLLAATNPLAADPLVDLAAAASVPLLVSTFGATTPRRLGRGDVAATVHGLHLADAAAALGAWTVREHGPRVGVLASDREAMFDLIGQLGRGVTSAGGTMAALEIVSEPGELAAAADRLEQAGLDALHIEVAGRDAAPFLDLLEDGSFRGVPVTIDPLASGGDALPACASWSRGTDPAAVLGAETGSLLVAALRRGGGHGVVFPGTSFDTDRGRLRVSSTGVTAGPVAMLADGRPLAVPPGDRGNLSLPVAGVTNEFLCL